MKLLNYSQLILKDLPWFSGPDCEWWESTDPCMASKICSTLVDQTVSSGNPLIHPWPLNDLLYFSGPDCK